MKVEIKDGKLVIDIIDALTELNGDQKKELINQLSCDNDVIKNVADQIVYGCTEDGWWGSSGCSENPSTPLDKAKRFVADNSSKIAKEEIERLTRLVELARESADKAWAQYHELCNSGRY